MPAPPSDRGVATAAPADAAPCALRPDRDQRAEAQLHQAIKLLGGEDEARRVLGWKRAGPPPKRLEDSVGARRVAMQVRDGLTLSQIARVDGCTPSAAKQSMRRFRRACERENGYG